MLQEQLFLLILCSQGWGTYLTEECLPAIRKALTSIPSLKKINKFTGQIWVTCEPKSGVLESLILNTYKTH